MSAAIKANADGSIEILANGATKIKVNADGGVKLLKPLTKVAGSGQAVSAGVSSKVLYTALESPASLNGFNLTLSRFLPLVAGWYDLKAMVSGLAGVTVEAWLGFYKNGSAYEIPMDLVSGGSYSLAISTLVYLNGATDYMEVFIYSGASRTIASTFSAHLVEAA